MAKSDGTLRFDTSLDTANLVDGVEQVSGKLDAVGKSVDAVSKKLEELGKTLAQMASTASLEDLKAAMDEAAKKAKEIKLPDVPATGTGESKPSAPTTSTTTDTSSIDNARTSLEAFRKSLEAVIAKLEQLSATMQQVTPSTGMEETKKELEEVRTEAETVGQRFIDLSEDTGSVFKVDWNASPKLQEIANRIGLIKIQMQQVAAQAEKLSNTKMPTAEYADYQKCAEKAEASLNRLLAQQELIVNTGGKQRGTTWDRLQYKIEEARNTLNAYKADMAAMESAGTAYTVPEGNDAKLEALRIKYQQLAIQAQAYQNKLNALSATETGAGTSTDNMSAKTSRFASFVSRAASTIAGFASKLGVVKSGLSRVAGIFSSAANGVRKFASGVSTVVKGLTKLVSSAGKAVKKVLSLGKGFTSAGKNANSLGCIITRTLRSLTLISGIRNMFTGLGSTIYSMLKTNDEFVSSLAEIKGNLYTAFQPIYEAVLPAVNALMSGLSKLSGYLAQITSQLFGKSVSASQAAAVAQYEEVQALEDTAEASQEANKQLSGIDELHNTASSSSSSGSSGSSSSSDSDTIVPDFSTAIEESSYLTELVDMVKKAWNNADFTEVGQTLAAKLNTSLQNIPWAGIQSTCQNIALSAATLLNGFFADPSLFATIGTTIGEGFNTIIYSVGAFVGTLEWSSVGASLAAGLQSLGETISWNDIAWDVATIFNGLADAIIAFSGGITWPNIGITLGNALNTFLNETEWAKLATGANSIINGIIQAAAGFITTFEWDTLGTDIGTMVNDFLMNTDWVTLFTGAAGLIEGIFSSILSFLQTVEWGEIATTIVDALCEVDWISLLTTVVDTIVAAFLALVTFFFNIGSELGCHIIDGLADGITLSEMLSNAWNWVKEHIVNPIVDTFKSLLGINSPSTVFADFGTYIMQGLINGITGLVDKVKEKFSTLVDNIKSFFTNIPTWFKEKFTAALTAIKSAFSLASIKSFFKSIWTAITNVFSNVTGWFKDKFKAAWDAVKNVFSSGSKVFSGIKEGIEDTFKSIVNTLISGINTIIATPFNKINEMLNTIRGISILGVSPFSGLWSENPLSVPQIPQLATGTVVPANYGEFLAMLGDNTREAEVVSPLSTMKEAMLEALKEYGAGTSGGNVQLTVQIGKKTIYQEVLDANNEAAKAGRPYLVTV